MIHWYSYFRYEVVLSPDFVLFRPQGKGSSHLATIEAIYYMLKHMDPLLTSRFCYKLYTYI